MKEKYVPFFENERLEEMSNLGFNSTGLVGYTLWITSKSGREGHAARIKLSNSDGEVSISIFGDPGIKEKSGKIRISGKDMKMIKRFIALNKTALMNHWNGITDSKEFGNAIKKLF